MKERESFKRIIQLSLAAVAIAVQVMIYRYLWYEYLAYEVLLPFWRRGHLLVIAIYALILVAFTSMYGGMKIGYYRRTEIIFSQLFATVITNIITYFQDSLMEMRFVRPEYFLTMLAADIVVIAVWANVSDVIYRKIFKPRDLVLIHGDRPYDTIVEKFHSRPDKFHIDRCVNYKDDFKVLTEEIIPQYDAVIIWDIPTEARNKILKYCYGHAIRVYIMPKIPDVILKGADQMNLFDTPILLTREYKLTFEQRFCKRLIDIVCSFILLIITSPFMLLTALAVKLYDGGPCIYKQVRCTAGGKEFKIMKFRSMCVDAEKDGVARLASKGDSRITPVGKFIRACRLDELPQLLNILKGEMSFIGPRPERPEIIAQYMEMMPEFAFRMRVKAGLAGYAQVYGKYNTTPYDKLKLDLYYIENYSVWLDIKLMLLTLKILLTPDSTEGVEASQITALREQTTENDSTVSGEKE